MITTTRRNMSKSNKDNTGFWNRIACYIYITKYTAIILHRFIPAVQLFVRAAIYYQSCNATNLFFPLSACEESLHNMSIH